MIPEALIVALSGSVSNHWSRKSAALIVMSWMKTARCSPGKVVEGARETRDGEPFAGTESAGIWRGHGQDRLDESRHLDHQAAVLVVGLRVARRPTPKLADGATVVVHPPQVVALERRECPVERQDLEAVLRQLELSDDLGPKQRDHVRGHAEPKAGEDLLGYRGPAENVAPFEHDDL